MSYHTATAPARERVRKPKPFTWPRRPFTLSLLIVILIVSQVVLAAILLDRSCATLDLNPQIERLESEHGRSGAAEK